jgi:CO/xanthine dehydrogenase FAD-binding subunit
VAPTVIRAPEAEALLTGHAPDTERLQQAAQAAMAAASPIDDIRGTAAHRRAIVMPLVQRTLHYAVQMAQGADLSFETQRSLAVQAVF